jgi:acyl-CoA thioester hydrolase
MVYLEEEKTKFKFKMKLDIRWSDMDEMKHVNNAVYLTYFEQARIYYFGEALKLNWEEISFIQANAYIDYVRPLFFPDPAYVYLRANKFGNKSFEISYLVTSLVNGKEELSASGYTTLVMFDYKTNQTKLIPDSLKETIRNYEPEKI